MGQAGRSTWTTAVESHRDPIITPTLSVRKQRLRARTDLLGVTGATCPQPGKQTGVRLGSRLMLCPIPCPQATCGLPKLQATSGACWAGVRGQL